MLKKLGSLKSQLSMQRALRKAGARRIVNTVKRERLTYLSNKKLLGITTCIGEIEKEGVAGDFIEAGCALGGSSAVIAECMGPSRRLTIYDVFSMIPPPSENDTPDVHDRYKTIEAGESKGIGDDEYYGYMDDLKSVVERNLSRLLSAEKRERVTLVEGLVQDTLAPDGAVAFAHVDVDWYDPVKVCLERIAPRLSAGGVIILDDYKDWGGCRKAVDEFLDGAGEAFNRDMSFGNLILTRR
ncbi:MAG: hypothetical protein Tsb0010_01980 [Parvularculaceae bacterium]